MASLRTLQHLSTAILLLCGLTCVPAFAQQNGPANEDQALVALEKQFCISWAGHAFSQMEPLLSPEFLFVDEEAGVPREQFF